MRKLLIAAIALLTITTGASADRLPNAFIGRWCSIETLNTPGKVTTRYLNIHYMKDKCHQNDGDLDITRDLWVGHRATCTFISVKADYRVLLAHVSMRCRGEGETWATKVTITYDKGLLIETVLN